MRVVEMVVDVLPQRVWRVGNLYMPPGGTWHFCVGKHPKLPHSVRTVEWRGREVARWRRVLDPTVHGGSAARSAGWCA